MKEEKIPTAEELIDECNLHTTYYPMGDVSRPKMHDIECYFCSIESEVEELMIKFAKLHVKAALKAASKAAYAEESRTGYVWLVNEDSILNSYPDKLIK